MHRLFAIAEILDSSPTALIFGTDPANTPEQQIPAEIESMLSEASLLQQQLEEQKGLVALLRHTYRLVRKRNHTLREELHAWREWGQRLGKGPGQS